MRRKRRARPLLRPVFSLSLIAVMCVSVSAQVVEKKKDSVRFIKPAPLEKAADAPAKSRAPDARPVGNVEVLPLTDADKLNLASRAQVLNLQTSYDADAAPKGFALPHTKDQAWMRKVAGSNPRSPAASGQFVVVGSGNGCEVFGINIETGERKWRYASRDAGISNIEIDGDSAYYTTYSCTLERVRVLTGVNVFSKWLAHSVDNQPVVADGRVYCSFQGNDGVRLTATEADHGGDVWSVNTAGANGIQGPVVADGCIMLATVDGGLGSYSLSGKVQWKRQLGLTAAPVAVPGGILCVTPADMAVVEQEPKKEEAPAPSTGPEQAKPESDKDTIVPVKPSPVVPGTLVTHGNVRLGLLAAKEAPMVNMTATGGGGGGMDYQGARPGYDGEMVFFAAGGHISALALASNALQWDIAVAGGDKLAFTTPVTCGSLVITASNNGYVLALSRRTGSLVWCYKFEGQSFISKPAIGEGRLLITSASGTLISMPTGLSSNASVAADTPDSVIAREFAKNRTPEAPQPADPNAGGNVEGKPESKPGDTVENPPAPEPAPAPQPAPTKGEFERAEKRKVEREAAKGKEYDPKPFKRE